MNYKQLLKENQLYYRSFVSRSVFYTLRKQGSHLSYTETYALAFNGGDFLIYVSPRQIYEILNYKWSMDRLLHVLDTKQVMGDDELLEVARMLYKDAPIHVNYTSDSSRQMVASLLETFEKKKFRKEASVYQQIATMYIELCELAPFTHGNQSLAELCMIYFCLRKQVPPILIPELDAILVQTYVEYREVKKLATYLQTQASLERQIINKCV